MYFLYICIYFNNLGFQNINACPNAYRTFSSVSNSVSSIINQNNFTAFIKEFGQPVAETHPHLISEGELVPGVTLNEFQQRRTRFIVGIQKYAVDYLQNVDSNRRSNLVGFRNVYNLSN